MIALESYAPPVLSGWYEENRARRGFKDENILNIFRKYDLGEINDEGVIDYFSKYKDIKSTKDELKNEVDSYLKLNNSLIGVIKKLRRKGFKTVLLTNSNTSFFENEIYVKYPEFKSYFDEIVISSAVKMVKPNADIFLYTLGKTDSLPEESLFIDDSKENIDAAIRLGVNGFLYANNDLFVEYIKKLGIVLEDITIIE